MTDGETLVQQFVSVWNETDQAARRKTIEAIWAPGGRHLMGANDACGYDALEDRVRASHERSVQGGTLFRPATAIQTLPGVVKFRWDMVRKDGSEITAAGVGFLTLDGDRRIICDYLFAEA